MGLFYNAPEPTQLGGSWQSQVWRWSRRKHQRNAAVMVNGQDKEKCVHDYLADALQSVTGHPGRQRLRSSSTSALVLALTQLLSATNRSPSPQQELGTVCHQKWRHQAVSDHSRLSSRSVSIQPLSHRWLYEVTEVSGIFKLQIIM